MEKKVRVGWFPLCRILIFFSHLSICFWTHRDEKYCKVVAFVFSSDETHCHSWTKSTISCRNQHKIYISENNFTAIVMANRGNSDIFYFKMWGSSLLNFWISTTFSLILRKKWNNIPGLSSHRYSVIFSADSEIFAFSAMFRAEPADFNFWHLWS